MNLFKWNQYVRGKLIRAGIPVQDLDDVSQDVFLRAYRYIESCTDVIPFLNMQVLNVLTARAEEYKAKGRDRFEESWEVLEGAEWWDRDSAYPQSLYGMCTSLDSRYIDELKELAPKHVAAYWLNGSARNMDETYRFKGGTVARDAREFARQYTVG